MLEVQIVDTNDFTKKFRRRKSDEMSQGVCVMEAADASGSTADFFLEVYQSKATEQNKRQMNNRLWFSDSHFYFSTYEDLKLCFHIKSVG